MSKKILVVDDELTTVKLLENHLKKCGYDVVVARNGEVALERFAKERPDLIILDVEMPRIDGYTLLRELQKDENFNTPVVMLTGNPQYEGAFANKGVKDFLVKPVDFQKLQEVVEQCLS